MRNVTQSAWIYPLVCVLIVLLKVEGSDVSITYVQSAVQKGAVCLDGSPPAYHLSRGSGLGVNNWLVHIEGGGWCDTVESCFYRKNTSLGSSRLMVQQRSFFGILNDDQKSNPDFYNWNRVLVRYCDGSSFTGDVEKVDPAMKIYFRGARVWQAVMDDLLARGMSNAQNALLSGCSAGGLASILHCDRFQSLFKVGTRVKCLSDAGFFIHGKDITGTDSIKNLYNGVVTTHGSVKNLPPACTSKQEPSMCFFPQYMAQLVRTPLFILNPTYDTWQIGYILVPDKADPSGTWTACKTDIKQCSSTQLQTLQEFRVEFLNALASIGYSASRGFFINSCFVHCQSDVPQTWFGDNSPALKNIRIATAVGNWYYDRSSFREIDCPYPCDTSCFIWKSMHKNCTLLR